MTKRLLTLNGLAALMVVLNHSASYGLNALFFWTDRYRQVAVPNFDQYGSPAYYVLFFIHELAEFAIPAFLFISGFFIAFATRTAEGDLKWEIVISRIKKLILPFLLWSVVIAVLLQRFPPTFRQVMTVYYYIPLIVQYYLLSPYLVPLARRYPQVLLIGTAFLQLGLESLRLLDLLGLDFPGMRLLINLTPIYFFPGRIFYFSIGLVAGLNLENFNGWLTRYRWGLLIAAFALLALSIAEYMYLTRILDRKWLVPEYSGIFRALFAIAFSLSLIAFEKIPIPFSENISRLGSKSLGIYFINTPALYVIGLLMYHFMPGILGVPLLYQIILIAIGLGTPLLLMEFLRKIPGKKIYHVAFG